MKKILEVRMEFDVEHNLAYIDLRPANHEKQSIAVCRWMPLQLPVKFAQNIVIDFAAETGQLLGFELQKASEQLYPELVASEGMHSAMTRVHVASQRADWLPVTFAVDALKAVHRISAIALGVESKE
jgi:hypothetical protein